MIDVVWIQPTTHKIKLHSVCCNLETFVFFTNDEIWRDTYISAWCKTCKRTTNWRMQINMAKQYSDPTIMIDVKLTKWQIIKLKFALWWFAFKNRNLNKIFK